LVNREGFYIGYGDLVRYEKFKDYERICPVIFDATHSVQSPAMGGLLVEEIVKWFHI